MTTTAPRLKKTTHRIREDRVQWEPTPVAASRPLEAPLRAFLHFTPLLCSIAMAGLAIATEDVILQQLFVALAIVGLLVFAMFPGQRTETRTRTY